MARPRAVVVHGLDHLRAALAAAREAGAALVIESAPGAGAFAGAPWFLAMLARARAEYPEVEVGAVLDCGDRPGAALAALRAGVSCVRLAGPAGVRRRVAEIAAQLGARLDAGGRETLDLAGEADPGRACRAWLQRP
ncbi:MAG: hypothetical protein HY521_10520 [Proteobacteria bacterium]|nr:hypothetical protein [Pseudomonadota bacterium]